jgi:hypothetical protein
MLAGERGRILDISFPAAEGILLLRKQGFSVAGIDLSPVMLSFACRRFPAGEVQFCRADRQLITSIRAERVSSSTNLGFKNGGLCKGISTFRGNPLAPAAPPFISRGRRYSNFFILPA